MLLQADVPLGVTSVARVRGELARFHLGLPIRAPELVLDDLHPVEPMLDVFPIHHEAYLVPLTRGLHDRSEEHTSELQSQSNLVCRLLLEKKKKTRWQSIGCRSHYRTCGRSPGD